MTSVEIVTTILTIVALVLAIVHLVALHRQVRAAKAHTGSLHEIQHSLSTRYIGQFPEYFPEILTLVGRAKREIAIFVDLAGYCSFTDPKTFFSYRQTIERKIKQEDVLVSITCYTEDRRKKLFDEQFFRAGEDWDQLKKSSEKTLRTFLQAHNLDKGFDSLSKEDFVKLLESDERRFLSDTFAGATTHGIDAHIPLYFWLVDGVSAIFTIPSLSETTLEYGFATTDQKLIAALRDMRNRYHGRTTSPLAKPAAA